MFGDELKLLDRFQWQECHLHTADLVGCANVNNLPSRLRPFVRMAKNGKHPELTEDTKAIVFKVRGTLDSYQVVFSNGETTIKDVEKELIEDLDCVISSDSRRRLIQAL
jgi:hypothetical protein